MSTTPEAWIMQSISEVKKVPEGYHSVNSFLIVEGAEKLIQFLKQAFDGKVEESVKGPDGRIAHAELTVGDSIIMLADATPKYGATSVHLYVYLENVDLTFKRAIDAGASSVQEPADQFYGDRTAGIKDPTGNYWWIAQHLEDVSPEELGRRMKARSQSATV
jgi:PhnB protein